MTKGQKLYYYFLNKYGSKEKEGIVLDDSGMSKLVLEIFAMTDETFNKIIENKKAEPSIPVSLIDKKIAELKAKFDMRDRNLQREIYYGVKALEELKKDVLHD